MNSESVIYNFTMLLLRQILVIVIVLAICAVGLSACGQQGALYLPSDAAYADRTNTPPAPPRATAVSPAESGWSAPDDSKPSALPASATP